MRIGEELQVRLERGRTFALTARIGMDRVFVRETDPVVSYANPGEVWRASVTEQHRDDLWRIELLERLSQAPVEPRVFDVEPFRSRAIPIAHRHRGNGTQDHLGAALATLPELIEVGFFWEDRKGPFGICEGVVVRPAFDDGSRTEVIVGGRYLVTIKSSGSRGLYAAVLACVEGAAADGDARVPDQFEIQFSDEDSWGLFGVFGAFKIRPDRNWPYPLRRGATVVVWTVSVLRRSCNVAFVMPRGYSLSGTTSTAASANP